MGISDSILHSIAYGAEALVPMRIVGNENAIEQVKTIRRIAIEALNSRLLLRRASRDIHDWISSARGMFHRDAIDDSRVVRDAIRLHLDPTRDAPQEDEAMRLLREVHAHLPELRALIEGRGAALGAIENTLETIGAFLEPKVRE